MESKETSNIVFTDTLSPMRIIDTQPIALRWFHSHLGQMPKLQYAYTEYDSGKGNKKIVWADVQNEYADDYVGEW